MKRFITAEQAISVLPDCEDIHTLLDANFGLVGADWTREKIIKKLECADYIELTGTIARAMGHGICIYDKDATMADVLFIETDEEKLAKLENSELTNEQPDNKLKPCPFCGDTATLCKNTASKFIVECNECLAQTGEYEMEETAVMAWNRSVNIPPMVRKARKSV